MRPRVHVPPCKFCHREFQRTEHLHRHERTHTREKPFSCHCGRAFSRGDLLSRHARLAHASHTSAVQGRRQQRRDRIASPDPASLTYSHDQNLSHVLDSTRDLDIEMPDPSAQQNLPVNEPTALSVANIRGNSLSVTAGPSIVFESEPRPAFPGPSVDQDASIRSRWDVSFDDDLDLLWSDFETSASWLMPSSFIPSYPMDFLASTQNGFSEFDPCYVYNNAVARLDTSNSQNSRNGSGNQSNNENYGSVNMGGVDGQHTPGTSWRYESRLPSMQPIVEPREDNEQNCEMPVTVESSSQDHVIQRVRLSPCVSSFHTPGMPWRISREAYHSITASIKRYDSLLPPDFVFPTRHTLCRYIEGYFSGFHGHLPFLHLPTISIVASTPELILAIAAVGARYRFQRRQAYQLYLAAKAVLEDQLRHKEAHDLPSSGTLGLLANGNFPSLSSSVIRLGEAGSRERSERAEAVPCGDALEHSERDLQFMQAMIILTAMGTWNHGTLLNDGLSMAGRLALMVREDCQLLSSLEAPQPAWSEWIAMEGQRRTKIVAMCLLNLQSIAYNVPPKLPHSELGHLELPAPEAWWGADSEIAWQAARSKDVYHEVTLQTSYASLFAPQGKQSQITLSSFGNYVLIHCIIQQIFFSRQLLVQPSVNGLLTFPLEILPQLDLALRRWQDSWERTKDCSLDPSVPSGPMSFNSTALFRLAYIRLSADFGPCRKLESRDPASSIAHGFRKTGLLDRSSYVGRAVLQSVHSLSIPIRIGIEFVARTQALSWSIVHSLCNLECALFLAKWLETMASVLGRREELRDDEKRLLGIVASIISETDLGPEVQREHDLVKRSKLMAIAVLRLWGYTFKGVHVYDIMGNIGAGLDRCAEMLQREINDN
ncbi:hypothetical protein F5884DRAFT_806585 [Xylogone sp. PMI_703]|nr:hypothetical protein F5884DRAFT_806585 [Xylogone sp. PMI_703]